MKGITPIISIIILLLITIGLASAAWTYMSGYFTGLTAKNLDILPPTCIAGVNVSFLVRNIGTGNVGAADIYGTNVDTGTAVTLNWFMLNGTALVSPPAIVLSPGTSLTARVNTPCTIAGTGKICRYTFTISGSNFVQDVTASCSG